MLHVFAESFASCLTKFSNMPSVSGLESTIVCLPGLFLLWVLCLYFVVFQLIGLLFALSVFTHFAKRFHHIFVKFVRWSDSLLRPFAAFEFGVFRDKLRLEATSLCYLKVFLLFLQFLLSFCLFNLLKATVVKLNVFIWATSARCIWLGNSYCSVW